MLMDAFKRRFLAVLVFSITAFSISPLYAEPPATYVEEQLITELNVFTQKLAQDSQATFLSLYQQLLTDQLKAEELHNQYQHLLAQHSLYLAHFDSVLGTIKAHNLNDKYRIRTEETKAQYLAQISPWLAAMDALFLSLEQTSTAPLSPFSSTKVAELLKPLDAKLKNKPLEILRASNLPYSSMQLASRKVVVSPAIVPSYLKTAVDAPILEDRKASLQASLTDPVLLKAKELEYDPIKIYEFVHDIIKTEWYAGAMKGAEGTLLQGSGNAVDQASLLIALYRAGSIPARYVTGVIEIPIEQVQNMLGVAESQQAVIAIRRSGLAVESIIRGGKIAAVKVEHTWVSALIPYANYRGATVDKTGEAWLPLMPSIKAYEQVNPTGILSSMNLNARTFHQDYLSTLQNGDALSVLHASIGTFLAGQGKNADIGAQLGSSRISAEKAGYLPNSLPVTVVAVTAENAEYMTSQTHHVRFIARSGADIASKEILSITLPLMSVESQRVTLSYQPGSVEDQKLVLTFGGLGNVPLYLVNVRPQIKVNGLPVAIANAAIPMGSAHVFEMQLIAPQGQYDLKKTVFAGGYHAIGIAAQNVHLSTREKNPADTETRAAEVLSNIALEYINDWNRAEVELAALANRALIRPLPTVTFSGNDFDVHYVFNLPERFIWKGVTLDAAFRVAETVPRTNALTLAEKDFMILAGLQGSALEHEIFERLYNVEGLSSEKAIALAMAQHIPVHRVTSANAAAVLPLLQHGNDVLNDVSLWLAQGYQVTIPETEMTYLDWRGSVWIVENLQTGTAGYFIARGLAGANTPDPDMWPDNPGDDLRDPYQGESNKDPLSATTIDILSGNLQERRVGEEGESLKVVIRDKNGAPVLNSEVVFKFSMTEGDSGTFLTGPIVLTNASGIAEIKYQFPTKINVDFVYKSDNELQYPVKTGVVYVTATTTGIRDRLKGPEAIALSSLFELYVKPGEPAQIEWISGDNNGFYDTANFPAELNIMDQYGNSVANAEVQLSVTNVTPSAPANINQPFLIISDVERWYTCPGLISYGDCGAPSQTVTSDFNGNAYFGIMYGDATLLNSTDKVPSVDFQVQAVAGTGNALYMFRGTSQKPRFEWSGPLRNAAGESGEGYLGKSPVWQAKINLTETETLDPKVPVLLKLQTATGESGAGYGHAFGSSEVAQYVDIESITMGLDPEYYFGAITWGIIDSKENPVLKVKETSVSPVGIPTVEITPQLSESNDIWIDTDLEGRTKEVITFTYNSLPETYQPDYAELIIREDGVLANRVSVVPQNFANKSLAHGKAILETFRFNSGKTYTGEFVFNRGAKGLEVHSEPFPFRLNQPIFAEHKIGNSTIQVDILNNESCASYAKAEFILTQQATVSLSITDVRDETTTIIDAVEYTAGKHSVSLPDNLDMGYYTFTYTGIAANNPVPEIHNDGRFKVTYDYNYGLPVGHANYENVDLYNGSLSLSRTDIAIPGRGPKLEFRRSYSSLNTDESTMGPGWSHNYDSVIHKNACNWVTVSGGDGGGIRFFLNDDGKGYKAGKGYHGSLIKSDNTWDFYSKDGTRYHYRQFSFDKPNTSWHLEYIQDTNGNVTSLGYNPNSQSAMVDVVADASGRKLTFTYKWLDEPNSYIYFENPLQVIESIRIADANKPDSNITVNYEYKDLGRLTRVINQSQGDTREETYDYEQPVDGQNGQFSENREMRVALKHVIDARGHTTGYTYEKNKMFVASDLQNGAPKDQAFVKTITRRDGGVITFVYGNRESRVEPLETSYTDARGKPYSYTLNTYGSPLQITTPAGNKSHTWKTGDILMATSIDENGIVTTFDYDIHGNTILESVTGISPDIISTYDTGLMDGKIKDRLKTRTDRNGNTTHYGYDLKGNLQSIEYRSNTATPLAVENFYYDANGDVLGRTDRNGNMTRFEYDTYGNVIKTTDILGGVQTSTWDFRSRKTSDTDANANANAGVAVVNASKHTIDYEYDGFDRVKKITNALNGVKSLTYDANGNKQTETDEEGRVSSWTYDNEDRLLTSKTPDQETRSMTYDLNGNILTDQDYRLFTTHFVYDDANRKTDIRQPLGRNTHYTFDGVGNILTETDALGRETRHVYDNLHRQTDITYAVGTSDEAHEHTVLDGNGNAIEITDALGRKVTQVFDGLNRRIERTDRNAAHLALRSVSWTYDKNGNVLTTTDGNGGITENIYDKLNRVQEIIDAEGHHKFFIYDAVGNVTKEQDALLHYSSYTYDALNRRSTLTDPRDFVTTFQYDKVGNQTDEFQPNGNTIHSVFDVRNRLTAQSDSLGTLLTQDYDANGNVITSTDANGKQSTFEYDALNQKTDEHLPESRHLQSTYDVVGNVKTRIDAKGKTTRFDYDARNRLLTTTDALGTALENTQEITYDKLGNKLTDKDRKNHITQYGYDDLNRLLSTTDPLNQVVSNTYDANNNLLSSTDKRGNVTLNTYDKNNRLLTATKNDIAILANGYDEVGNLIVVRDARNNSIGYGYNERNELIRESREPIAITRYEVDSAGNRTKEKDPVNRETTTVFDVRHRPTSITNHAGETTTNTYDGNGNKLSVTRPEGNTWHYEYDDANRLVVVNAPEGITHYEYDKNNNLESQTDAMGYITSFDYDVLNRRTLQEYPGNAAYQWTYDANDNVKTQTDPNGTVTTFDYDVLNREVLRTFTQPAGVSGTNHIHEVGSEYDANNNKTKTTERYYQ